MDPISIISGLIGIVTAVIGIGSSFKQMADEDETQDYNRNLNQKIMDREDNSWQRAVEDRSKAGLSISGLSSGSGSGGTVSALQPKQGAGQFANLMQNMSSQAFGLANSAYDRKLQKEIHTDQLELERDKLKHEKLTTMFQHKLDLAKYLNIDKKIYEHNMSIAKGENKNPLARVYGTQPSEIESLLRSLINNRSTFKDKADSIVDDVYQGVQETKKTTPTNTIDSALEDAAMAGTGSKPLDYIPNNRIISNIPDSYKEQFQNGHWQFSGTSKDGNDRYVRFYNKDTRKMVSVRVTAQQYEYWKQDEDKNYNGSGSNHRY